jgi:hypothetical protein
MGRQAAGFARRSASAGVGHRRYRILALGVGALAALPGSAQAREYYVSPSGNDSASGSSSAPWRSVSKVNSASLAPGDSVLFLGGGTFPGRLMPSRSGSSAAPIRYRSYGSGKAHLTDGVWMRSVSNLSFEDLWVDGGNSNAFGSSPQGSGVKSITFSRTETRQANKAFYSAVGIDQSWTIRDCVIDGTQDSAIHGWAADWRIQGCRISNAGRGHAGYNWALHGIYVDGPRLVASGNEIWSVADPTGQAISTRFRDALIEGNYIHDTNHAIGYFRDDSGSGTTTVRRNRFQNIRNWVFYVGLGNRASGVGENFHVYNNTVINGSSSSGAAYRWSSTGGREFIFRNNAVQGYAAVLQSTSGVVQSHNLLGTLGLSGFTPAAGSRVVDAGSSIIKSGAITLSAGCTGGALSYCGSAPDAGAVERP